MKVAEVDEALIDTVCTRLREQLPPAERRRREAFVRQYYRWVSPEDIAERSAARPLRRGARALQPCPHAPAGHAQRPRLQPAVRRPRVAVDAHRGRDRHRRHAVPHRLGVDGAQQPRLRRPPDHPPGDEGAPRRRRRAPGGRRTRRRLRDFRPESIIHAEVARQTDPVELIAAEERARARHRRGARGGRGLAADARKATEIAAELDGERPPRSSTRPRRAPSSPGSPTTTSPSSATATTT